MKNGRNWIWIIIGGAGLVLTFYYFCYPFWPTYFWGNWGYRSFGPRFWFPFPFFGFFLIIILALILLRLLFSTSSRKSSTLHETAIFCPYCGRDLRSGEKSERTKGDENISLPRS